MKGISLIVGKNIFHFGRYFSGIWFDNNEKMKLPKKERTGYGVKIDLCFGRTIRPIGLLWKKGYWDNEKTRIMDIPKHEWSSYFGVKLANKISKLGEDRLHHGVMNPWYAKKWFVLRLPMWIPTVFVSFGFGKSWSFYIGNKSYKIDPMPGDRDSTWTSIIDVKRALKEKPIESYVALCPSATSRKTRMT